MRVLLYSFSTHEAISFGHAKEIWLRHSGEY